MNRTKIDWADYSINPIKGLCPMACSYCYARRMYKRYHWREDIEWNEQPLLDLKKIKEPSRIFVGSTIELFGPWAGDAVGQILFYARQYPQHAIILLTKQPQNLPKWSPFPKNVWVGVTVDLETDNYGNYLRANPFQAQNELSKVEASVKFLSFEPLRGQLCIGYNSIWWAEKFNEAGINWLIVGQQTPIGAKTRPNPDWIREIITVANAANVPVFVKDNISKDSVLDLRLQEMRQEYPRVTP